MFAQIRTVAIAVALIATAAVPALSAERPNQATYADIEQRLGGVPKFFELFPEALLPSTWNEFKTLELSTDTAIDVKTKELIALAVSAQIGCTSCIYFHSAAAIANGASGRELQEAVGLAIMTGNWSKALTNQHIEIVKADTNTLVKAGKLKAAPAGTN